MNPNFTDGYVMVAIVRMNYSEKILSLESLKFDEHVKVFAFLKNKLSPTFWFLM